MLSHHFVFRPSEAVFFCPSLHVINLYVGFASVASFCRPLDGVELSASPSGRSSSEVVSLASYLASMLLGHQSQFERGGDNNVPTFRTAIAHHNVDILPRLSLSVGLEMV